MTKRKVTKLFAVVALTASAPTLAGAEVRTAVVAAHDAAHHAAPRPDPWAMPDEPQTPVVQQVALLGSVLASLIGVAAPRQLPNGAPACGNVASRAPRPVDCGRTK